MGQVTYGLGPFPQEKESLAVTQAFPVEESGRGNDGGSQSPAAAAQPEAQSGPGRRLDVHHGN